MVKGKSSFAPYFFTFLPFYFFTFLLFYLFTFLPFYFFTFLLFYLYTELFSEGEAFLIERFEL